MIDICEQEQKIFYKNNFHCSHDCLCLLTTERKKTFDIKKSPLLAIWRFLWVSISNECFIASEQSGNTKPHAVLWSQLSFSVNYSYELCTAVLTQQERGEIIWALRLRDNTVPGQLSLFYCGIRTFLASHSSALQPGSGSSFSWQSFQLPKLTRSFVCCINEKWYERNEK